MEPSLFGERYLVQNNSSLSDKLRFCIKLGKGISNPKLDAITFLTCSTCEFTENFINHTLYKSIKAQWIMHWCPLCKKASTARAWACPCGLPWFTCNIHRAHSFYCKTTAQYRSPAELVERLAPAGSLPEPAHKKRRLGSLPPAQFFFAASFNH